MLPDEVRKAVEEIDTEFSMGLEPLESAEDRAECMDQRCFYVGYWEWVAIRAHLLAREAEVEGIGASVAAIQYALRAEDGMAFLRLWNEGNFDVCRAEWPDAPSECYIGADPLFNPQPNSAWPAGCKDANSCEKHRECMYAGCRHQGTPITAHLSENSRG